METVKISILLVFLTFQNYANACTIFCGKDKQGHIWAANNEDNAFSFVNYINVFPKTEDTEYGYYTVSYFTKKNGENFNIQGIYNYSFVVDGKQVFDSKTPVKVITSVFEDSYKTHELSVDFSSETYQTTIKVLVPNKDDMVYVSGNQRSMTNWNSIFRLKKISDYEREITLDLHFLAKFKFTGGSWDTEAIMPGNKKDKDGRWMPMEIDLNTKSTSYTISNWKDKL